MTQALEAVMVRELGSSTGSTKFRQLKEMLRISGILSRERMKYIPLSIIQKIASFSDKEWEEIWEKYRNTTTAMVKMNRNSLAQVRFFIDRSLR